MKILKKNLRLYYKNLFYSLTITLALYLSTDELLSNEYSKNFLFFLFSAVGIYIIRTFIFWVEASNKLRNQFNLLDHGKNLSKVINILVFPILEMVIIFNIGLAFTGSQFFFILILSFLNWFILFNLIEYSFRKIHLKSLDNNIGIDFQRLSTTALLILLVSKQALDSKGDLIIWSLLLLSSLTLIKIYIMAEVRDLSIKNFVINLFPSAIITTVFYVLVKQDNPTPFQLTYLLFVSYFILTIYFYNLYSKHLNLKKVINYSLGILLAALVYLII